MNVNKVSSHLVFWTYMSIMIVLFLSSESGSYFFGVLGREFPRGNYFDNFARLLIDDHLYYYPGKEKLSIEYSNVIALLFPLLWVATSLLGLSKLVTERCIIFLSPLLIMQVISVALIGTAPISISEIVHSMCILAFGFINVSTVIISLTNGRVNGVKNPETKEIVL